MADAVGLYLGSHSLDLVQLSGAFRRPRIVKVARATLKRPIPNDPEWIAALNQPLASLLQQCRLASPEAVIGISSEAAIIRYFQMQKLPPRDREAAIRFEAKKYLPFKLEELISDSQVAILPNDPNIMRVMFYAIKKEAVAGYLKGLQEAGVRAIGMETSLSSLTRLLRHTRQLEPGKAAVVLLIDGDVASIGLVKNELVYLVRNVTVLPPPVVEGGVVREPLAVETGRHRAADIHEALLNETVVSVDYYRRRFAGESPVSKVLVSADSMPPGWLRELAATLELPVESLTVDRELSGGGRITGNTAVAFGLALRQLGGGRSAINLLPHELKPKPRSVTRALVAELAAAAVILGVVSHLKSQPIRALTAEVNALQQTTAATLGQATISMTVDQLRTHHSGLEAEIRALQAFYATGTPAAIAIGELATSLPEAAWLHQIQYADPSASTFKISETPTKNRRTFAIAGSAHHTVRSKELEAVNTYVTALNNSPTFGKAFGAFNLTNMQRGSFRGIDITEFQIATEPGAGYR